MSKYVIRAVLSNPNHPEYGQATIPFPIPQDEYDHCLGLLAELQMGDAVRQDCCIDTIDCGYWPVLKVLEGQTVNVDELDYLAKRLESFDQSENAQFQAMAHKLGFSDIKDFINLTFCCQQVTVIDSFQDLESIGKDHLLHLNNGGMSTDEYKRASGEAIAKALILTGDGQITPYGVVYDNGMKMEPLYKGNEFPCYCYEPNPMVLIATPEGSENPTYLYLPSSQGQIDRALQRGGIDLNNAKVLVDFAQLPEGVEEALHFREETIQSLNAMCSAISRLDEFQTAVLTAAVSFAKPTSADQITQLANHLDQFDFIIGVKDPIQLGGYMIQQSGRFDYDPNLDSFYDFQGYGEQWIKDHPGQFTEHGYISYEGTAPLQEVLADASEGQTQGQQMM